MQKIILAQELDDTLNKITFLFPKKNSTQIFILAVCYSLNNEINFSYVNELFKFGGLIGRGKSNLDFFSNVSKYFGFMQFSMMLSDS